MSETRSEVLGKVYGLLEAASLALRTIPDDRVIDKYLGAIDKCLKLLDNISLEKLEEIREIVGQLHLIYFATFVAKRDDDIRAIVNAFRAISYADVYLKYVLAKYRR